MKKSIGENMGGYHVYKVIKIGVANIVNSRNCIFSYYYNYSKYILLLTVISIDTISIVRKSTISGVYNVGYRSWKHFVNMVASHVLGYA